MTIEMDFDFKYNGRDSLAKASTRRIKLQKELTMKLPHALINTSFSPNSEFVVPHESVFSELLTELFPSTSYNINVKGDIGGKTLVELEDHLCSRGFEIIKTNKCDHPITRDYCHLRRGEYHDWLSTQSKC